jgi:hypothetical protein
MFAKPRLMGVVVGSVFITVAPLTSSVEAVSVSVARKCDALTAKAFPPRVIGNPAAGSTKGTGADERAFYKRCVANGGKMSDQGGN